MAALDNPTLNRELAQTLVPAEIPAVLKPYIWNWFDAHRDTVVLKTKVIFFTIKITIGQLEPLIVMLAGPRPLDTPTV